MAKEPVLAPVVTTWIPEAHDHGPAVSAVEVVVEAPASE